MDSPAASPILLQGRFGGRSEFSDLIRQALSVAAVQGWREIIVCDPDFDDWPLGERAVAQALNDWSKSGRKFTMIAGNYTPLQRKHARFVRWRQTCAHIVECRRSATARADAVPSALFGPSWVLERLDLQHCSGIAGVETARRVALRERLNEVLLKSLPAFPASTLGL
ncbi:hypothetical protein SAMN05216344_13116 [Polaromonas sp. OV174]|uniref:hypothetical protein n=1 Tax=Polaromonas sp. OV174 TaxID=1855300 RepID=UPI0008E73576|nr:hypothetical protein [Polaromonas sp. OV174]SFC68954.1 hypothetical protein SAMN05216344_13116 [Polaromonas sp. OV174]